MLLLIVIEIRRSNLSTRNALSALRFPLQILIIMTINKKLVSLLVTFRKRALKLLRKFNSK
jgi:hypothetical protein